MIEKILRSASPEHPITIEFKKGIEDIEDYPETHMRANVIGLHESHSDPEIVKVTFDYEPHERYNAAFETANYYDKNQNPTLTAKEAGFYSAISTNHMMLESLDDMMSLFDEGPKKALYSEFLTSEPASYIHWLEDKVIALTDALEKQNKR